MCGYALSIGMPYDLYWKGPFEALDFYLAKYRHEQETLSRQQDILAWTIGSYVRVAIANVFDTKQQTKYPKEPFTITKEKTKAETREEKLLRQYQTLKNWSNRFTKG